jgi:hypothetical protein
MRRLRALLLALWGAALCLAPAGAEYDSLENSGEPAEAAGQGFLRRYGKVVFTALPVVMLAFYVLLMGPADVLDAARRARYARRSGFNTPKGFGSSGGFGGDPFKNPWE